MQTLNKIIAAIFSLLFIVAAVGAVFLFNLERGAFSVETYKQVFADEGFYNRIPSIMAETLLNATSQQTGLPFVLKGISLPDAEVFLRAIMPPDVIKSVGDEALNSIFAYVNQQSDTAQVSLVPLKANITSDASIQAVYGLLSNQPACTFEQLMTMTQLLLQQQIAFCNPPAELQPLITPILQGQLQALATILPDSVILISASNQPGAADPRENLRIIRGFMRFSPLLALALLVVYFLIVVLSFRNWLDWLGIPFLVIGASSAAIALLGGSTIRVLLQGILVRYMPAYVPALLLDYASQLAQAVTNKFLNPVFWEGVLLIMLGFVMLGISLLLQQRETI